MRPIPVLLLTIVIGGAGLAVAAIPAAAQQPPTGPEIWSLVEAGLGPRHGHTVTYDPVGDRLILFGGARTVVSSPELLADVWELGLGTDLTWRPMHPTGPAPPARVFHSAAYDPANERILYFGGNLDQVTENADVWALSLGATPAWTHLIPGGTPPGHFQRHSAIFDPIGQRMIVFGGNGVFNDPGEVRVLSLSGTPTWSLVVPGGVPVFWRRMHTATYDPLGHRMVVIGGADGASSAVVASVLSLDEPMEWSEPIPNGPMLDQHLHSAVYDAADTSILVFGGFQQSGIGDQMWRLSLGSDSGWTEVVPPGGPPTARWMHDAVYDPSGDRMIMHGGEERISPGGATEDTQETWEFRLGADPSWTLLDPAGAQPTRGTRASMAVDEAGQRVIVSGGNVRDKVYTNQLHAKATTGEELWTPIVEAGTPPSGRAGHSTIVDTLHHRLIWFGGQTAGGTNVTKVWSNEVWSAPLGSNPVWTKLLPGGTPPSARSDHTALYDPTHQRMIVLGGQNGSGALADLWTLSLDGTPQWTQVLGPTPTGAVWGHTAILDAPRDRMIVFGGTSGSSSSNAVHALSLADTPAWSTLTPPGVKPGVRRGHNAIYDPVGQRMVVFGGTGSTGLLNDSWALPLWKPGAAWKRLQPLGTLPGLRSEAAAGYDSDGQRMLVFGGTTPTEVRPLFDTWALTLNSCAPPIIVTPPVAATLPFGSTATFSVAATGAVGYRWQKDGLALNDGGRVSGSSSAQLSIAGFQSSDVGLYRVQVLGACDTTVSDAVQLLEGCSPTPTHPPSHMAAWWAMDAGVGNSVPDVLNTRGNKHHASLTGAATLVPGMIGTAVRCDGVLDGLHVPNTLSPDLAKNATGLSIDAWILPRSGSSAVAYRMILAKGLLAHNTVHAGGVDQLAPGYALYLHGGGQLGFQMPDESYQPVRVEPSLAPMTMDEWHHVAVAVEPITDGGALYVDGVRVHTFTPPSAIIGNLADLYIGRFPPQLGAQVADSAFRGDIDEVELFTVAIDSSDVRKLWLAGCAGKAREMALLPSTISVRKNTGPVEVCASVLNFSAAPASYQWSLQAAGVGPDCPDSVPVTFGTASGTLLVGPGESGSITTSATLLATFTDAFRTCYRLTVTNLSSGLSFGSEGALVWSGSAISGKANCVPPQIGLRSGPGSNDGAQATAARSRVLAAAGANPSSGAALFTLFNDSTVAVNVDYELTTRDPVAGGTSRLLGLGGQAPGIPLTGTILVPASGSVDLPVDVSLGEPEPFVRDELLLAATIAGDPGKRILASSPVRSSEDTSLALTGVDTIAKGRLRVTVSPNPFRSSAHVAFTLASPQSVEAAVFDVLGRRVRALHAGTLSPGEHRLEWDGRDPEGSSVPAGIYLVRVRAGGRPLTLKVVKVH